MQEEVAQVPSGTVTWNRAKAFKEKLNTFVQELLKSSKVQEEEKTKCIMSMQVIEASKEKEDQVCRTSVFQSALLQNVSRGPICLESLEDFKPR